MRRDNHKRLQLNCSACQGSGRRLSGDRCRECRGKGIVSIANPFYVPAGELPTWFQLGGGEGWAREVRRQLALQEGRCWRSRQQIEFRRLCAMLEPWRLQSPVHSNSVAIAAIAPIVEQAWRLRGRLERPGSMTADTGWTKAVLGALVVEVRNRQALWEMGRMQARKHGPRFDIERIPDQRLEALIQSHPSLELVDRLRSERARRQRLAA